MNPDTDIAIVGAGLCGLALAALLQTGGCSVRIYEARSRIGGRMLSSGDGDGALDLGPAWYWPDTQPRIAGLVERLGLANHPQHDDGSALCIDAPAQAPRQLAAPGLHGGARRLVGGMAALGSTLAAQLGPGTVQLGQTLVELVDSGEGVLLQLRSDAGLSTVRARRVVLALPPRLAASIRYHPALPPALHQALNDTPTWMATAAKAVLRYRDAHWRRAGASGNAFITHADAVLGEIYDACGASGTAAALAGFVARSPMQRQTLGTAALLMQAQTELEQLFGESAAPIDTQLHDWSTEPLSCSDADRAMPALAHPVYGDQRLATPQWNGRLRFAGSETASHGGGYLEGALDAAARVATMLLASAAQADTGPHPALDEAVRVHGERAFEHYRRALHQRLSSQHSTQLTRLALGDAITTAYREALAAPADPLPNRAALAPWAGFGEALLQRALRFNSSSCALSNFPEEHRPDAGYLRAIRADLDSAWRAFAAAAATGRPFPTALPKADEPKEPNMDLVYKTTMLTQGGRSGQVQSEDGGFKLKLAVPKEMGGKGDGPNPEQLFAAAFAACFEHSVRHIARIDKLPLRGCFVEAELSMYVTFEEAYRMALTLNVTLAGPLDQPTADSLLQRAKGICPYCDATKTNMTLNLNALLDPQPATA